MKEIQLNLSLSDDQVAVLLSQRKKRKSDDENIKDALYNIIFDHLDEEVEKYHAAKRLEIMQAKMPDIYLAGGSSWMCPVSPDGWCWYDHDEDPCHDDCLFCHEPEERK